MKSEPMNLNEVATEDLVAMLRHVSVETGSLACLGCGHEHNCGTRGCALIREAADRLDASRAPTLTPPNEWVSVEERLPEQENTQVLMTDGECHYISSRNNMVRFLDCEGIFIPGKAGAGVKVTHWMPLPAPPDRRPPEGEEDSNV